MAWLPLESNPDVINKYLERLGVPSKWGVVDVYGLSEEALAWIPRPALALLLLFPISEKHEQFSSEQAEALKESGGPVVSSKVYYCKQVVHNACGTIALIHAIANNSNSISLGDGPLKQFLEDTVSLPPEKRGELLQHADGIINAHRDLAMEGQTEAPEPTAPVNHHFVAFVEVDGSLYELDGRKEFPINHGPTSPDTLVEDAARICREYIERDPDDVRFTVCALAAMD